MVSNPIIYKISNILNNKFYIGSSFQGNVRWKEHLKLLKKNKHFNNHLQNAWNKYGEQNFTFETIEKCEKDNLIEREQFWIDILKPQYNKRKIADSNIGIKHSEQSRYNMSQAHIGIKMPPFTEKHKKKISQSLSGDKSPTAKINWEHVKEIREKYNSNLYSYRELAKEYCISHCAIIDIIKFRSWRE